jgi:N-acetylmuramoyl-L-alanine amidase
VRRSRAAFGLAFVFGVLSCSRSELPGEARQATSPIDSAAALLRSVGSSSSDAERANAGWDAAQLVEGSYRSTGSIREAEAAIKLYEGLVGGPLACRGELHGAALRAELARDPERVRSVASALRRGSCAVEAAEVLSVVGDGDPTSQEEISSGPIALDPTRLSNDPVRVVEVERYGSTDSARIVVHLSSPAEYRAGALPPEGNRGPRLYVDITQAEYAGANNFEVGGVVERVRLGQSETGVRVVLDLRERVYQRVFYLPEPFRLVIDVSNEAPRAHRAEGERQVTRVVLDPGHGGHDPGAIGITGLQEKDVALDLALRAAPLIARELGVDTLLTRDSDAFIELDQRVAKANAFGADLFISLHCNASESREGHGVMTFVLDESVDVVAQRVAARENAASADASPHFASWMSQVMDAESVARSTHFAELLQRASMASLQPNFSSVADGGVRQAGFFVLAGAEMPAVLFEASFISNEREEQRLDTVLYRQKIADAIVNAIRAYRSGL